MDNEVEKHRAAQIRRKFNALLVARGFTPHPNGVYLRQYGQHHLQAWLQKFSRQPFLFRVAYSFRAYGSPSAIVEFADPKFTSRGAPGGRTYDFGFRWGDDAVEKCIAEMAAFVDNVVLPWGEQQASAASADPLDNEQI